MLGHKSGGWVLEAGGYADLSLSVTESENRKPSKSLWNSHFQRQSSQQNPRFVFNRSSIFSWQCARELTKQPLSLLGNGIVKTLSRIVRIFPLFHGSKFNLLVFIKDSFNEVVARPHLLLFFFPLDTLQFGVINFPFQGLCPEMKPFGSDLINKSKSQKNVRTLCLCSRVSYCIHLPFDNNCVGLLAHC